MHDDLPATKLRPPHSGNRRFEDRRCMTDGIRIQLEQQVGERFLLGTTPLLGTEVLADGG